MIDQAAYNLSIAIANGEYDELAFDEITADEKAMIIHALRFSASRVGVEIIEEGKKK